jgi:hypothetical protein
MCAVHYNAYSKAFDVASSLGIAALLDASDMVEMEVPDKLCIITYVAQYHSFFRDKTPMTGACYCIVTICNTAVVYNDLNSQCFTNTRRRDVGNVERTQK